MTPTRRRATPQPTGSPISPATATSPEDEALTSPPAPPGSHLPDGLVDTLDRTFRRLRRAMIRPPAGLVPVPAIGRQLDIAKIFACDAVSELSARGTVSVKDVAAELDLEHSTVSRLLGDVEADGLVTRGVDPGDRRRTTVALTDLGRAVVADSTAISRFFTRLLLRDWPQEDVEALTTLLARLADTVQDKLDEIPALAMAEFAKAHPELAEVAAHIAAETHAREQGC